MQGSQVRISTATARQKVNVLMLERVNHLLLSGEPTLILNNAEKWVWRVPVDFTYGRKGRIATVGEIDVDASQGRIYFDDDILAQIARNADKIAQTEAAYHEFAIA